MPTLADLVTPVTRDRALSSALALLAAAGFPVTAWGSTSDPRAILETEAQAIADLSTTIAGIAEGGVLDLAEGGWLDLLAEWWGETRQAAVITQGTRTLVETANAPQTWGAGELVIASSVDPTLVYRNVGSVSLPALGEVAVTFAAEAPGAAYNRDASELGELATPVPGVSIATTTGLGWITQSGADTESDADMRVRLRAKWGELTTTGPAASYLKWVLDASNELNRIAIIEDATAVPPSAAVRVIVAATTGVPTSGALTAAQAYVEERRPLGVVVAVEAAAAFSVAVRGTVKVLTAYRASAELGVAAALDAYSRDAAIGGTVYLGKVYDLIMSVPGVVDVDLTNLDGTPRTLDWFPGATDVPVVDRSALGFTNV